MQRCFDAIFFMNYYTVVARCNLNILSQAQYRINLTNIVIIPPKFAMVQPSVKNC